MMGIKQAFLEYIAATKKIIEPLHISDSGLGLLPDLINTAELIVPVVGGFSAGKSSLINSFIGENLLPTAVTPETSLATELRYAKSNYIEAISSNGSSARFEIAQFDQIKANAAQYQFIKLYLNNNNLKTIQPLVLVDMPGFDSPVETQNQAILNYLMRGAYFIFLTSVEDGTIVRTMLAEIKNLYSIGKGFSFCISKTNLRPVADVQAVKENISKQLQIQFDYQQAVVLLDDNGGTCLKKILDSINPEQLFKLMFITDLQQNYADLIDSINLAKTALHSSQEDCEYAIDALQDSIKKIENKKAKIIKEIKDKYANSNINAIIDSVGNAIFYQKDYLVNLAISSEESFSTELTSLVKNTLISEVNAMMSELSSNIVSDFAESIHSHLHSVEGFKFDEVMLDNMRSKVTNLLQGGAKWLNKYNDSVQQGGNAHVGSIVYKALATVLGITTSIVSPVIELIIIFLPEIVNMFGKEQRLQKQKNQIEMQLINSIIPSIKAEIRNKLPECIMQGAAEIIENASLGFEQILAEKHQEISAQKTEQDKQIQSVEQQLHALDAAQQQLQSNAKNSHILN